MKSPFSYYGGKYRMLKNILPLFPSHGTYVEPFCGSMSVLLAKKPAKQEVANDIDGNVVNFFQVLREQPDELIRRLTLTPFARTEHANCRVQIKTETDPIERARQFFVLIRQSFNSIFGDSWKCSSVSSRQFTLDYTRAVDRLDEVVNRLRTVAFENRDAIKVMETYDSANTLHYCDPPYVLSTRGKKEGYVNEMSDELHVSFLSAARRMQGMVLVSGYRSELYEDMLKGWERKDFDVLASSSHHNPGNVNPKRVESVWLSPSVTVRTSGVISFD